MQIRRTYKEKSLKFGKVEIVDEAKAREVFGQSSVRFKGGECESDAELAMANLLKGETVSTFFSEFQLIEA